MPEKVIQKTGASGIANLLVAIWKFNGLSVFLEVLGAGNLKTQKARDHQATQRLHLQPLKSNATVSFR